MSRDFPKQDVSQLSAEELRALWSKLHEQACAQGADFYRDPETGYLVGTAFALKKRKCCRCGCRHCPYGFKREDAE